MWQKNYEKEWNVRIVAPVQYFNEWRFWAHALHQNWSRDRPSPYLKGTWAHMTNPSESGSLENYTYLPIYLQIFAYMTLHQATFGSHDFGFYSLQVTQHIVYYRRLHLHYRGLGIFKASVNQQVSQDRLCGMSWTSYGPGPQRGSFSNCVFLMDLYITNPQNGQLTAFQMLEKVNLCLKKMTTWGGGKKMMIRITGWNLTDLFRSAVRTCVWKGMSQKRSFVSFWAIWNLNFTSDAALTCFFLYASGASFHRSV